VVKWMLASLAAAVALACDAPATTSDSSGETGPNRPPPSTVGALSVRPDTGTPVAGGHLHVEIDASDASGVPIDAGNAEVTSTNTVVAQLTNLIAIPIPKTDPHAPTLYTLSATFDLESPGSTAIRARLGILTDSVVIVVVAAPSASVASIRVEAPRYFAHPGRRTPPMRVE
jgi:hypothetical protein